LSLQCAAAAQKKDLEGGNQSCHRNNRFAGG
jgi:hypothetical protein